MNQNSNDLCWKASLLSSDYLVLFPVLFPRGSVNCFCKVTVIFNSIYFLHFTQFKTADSAIYFLFFSLLLSQLSVVQKQMTPKPSHLKQLLSWFWGLSGLRWFSAVMAGGQSWGLRHLSVSGSSAGAVGQNACLWPPSWFGFLNSMSLGCMNVAKTPGRGWVAFYDLPPEVQRSHQWCSNHRLVQIWGKKASVVFQQEYAWDLVAIWEDTLIVCIVLWRVSSFFSAMSAFHGMGPVRIAYQF